MVSRESWADVRAAQLSFRPLHIPFRRVQVFVAQNLGQAHEVIAALSEKPMGHRVSKVEEDAGES
jgi:hypothetical protein